MDLARHLVGHAAGAALLAAALMLSAAVPPGARAAEHDDFTYEPGAPNGPENWGTFKPDKWGKCSTGHMQSPIDLSDGRAKLVRSLGRLDYSYHPAQATILNSGHDIKVMFKGDAAGSLMINGTVYHLKEIHWHTPSEHTVNGRRYDMELHLVHMTPENNRAVVGVLFKISPNPDPFLKKLEPFIVAATPTRDQAMPIGVVDPNGAACTGCVYYRYMGSLTTPPCTEGVVWTVCDKVRPVHKSQIELLQQAVDAVNRMNARPLQPLNNRPVRVFRPLLNVCH